MNLALVFHNHQPVGQLPWAIEDVAEHGYEPFLEELDKHPTIPVALHYTGPLLDWLSEHRPRVLERLQALVQRGQVEILGGGYYEPILAIWPPEDQRAQIAQLRRRAGELFGAEPHGLWLAERVWEPELAPLLRACQVDYTFVDSAVFETAKIPEEKQFGYYETREGLKLFPINEKLRYSIPWHTPEEIIAQLKEAHEEHGDKALALFADDGEKFGAWPGTFKFIYTEGWLEKFFTLLAENEDWLHVVTPQQYTAARRSLGTIDLPAGSYAEMQQWSGGNWRNFLQRYPESHDMFDEVTALHWQLKLAENEGLIAPEKRDAARQCILRAQCNDAYWHGTFGGLYLRHLRQAIYAEVAEAQRLLDSTNTAPAVGVYKDGKDDEEKIYLTNDELTLGAHPKGGQIFLLNSKIARHNLLSTLRRHKETYLGEESDLDWYARGALIDHFFGEDATPKCFAEGRFPEEGDFVSEAWIADTRTTATSATLLLQRDGHVWVDGVHQPFSILKQVSISHDSGELDIAYEFTNRSKTELKFWWACEWNAAVTGVALPDRHYHAIDFQKKLPLDEIAQFDTVKKPILADRYLQLWLEWQFEAPIGMWHTPIFTVSQKEGGEIERTHQSSAFVFHRTIRLHPGETMPFRFKAVVSSKTK